MIMNCIEISYHISLTSLTGRTSQTGQTCLTYLLIGIPLI